MKPCWQPYGMWPAVTMECHYQNCNRRFDQRRNKYRKANILAPRYANTKSHTKKFLKHVELAKPESDTQSLTITTDTEVEALNTDFALNELKDAIRRVKCNKSSAYYRILYELLMHLHRSVLRVVLKYHNWTHYTIVPLIN